MCFVIFIKKQFFLQFGGMKLTELIVKKKSELTITQSQKKMKVMLLFYNTLKGNYILVIICCGIFDLLGLSVLPALNSSVCTLDFDREL